jgi:hypothetical protein
MRAIEPQMQWYVSSLCVLLSPGLSVDTTLREITLGIALCAERWRQRAVDSRDDKNGTRTDSGNDSKRTRQ